jgi:hypothetical protein
MDVRVILHVVEVCLLSISDPVLLVAHGWLEATAKHKGYFRTVGTGENVHYFRSWVAGIHEVRADEMCIWSAVYNWRHASVQSVRRRLDVDAYSGVFLV